MKVGPEIVQDGLILSVDADNVNSYPGSGTNWIDQAKVVGDLTLVGQNHRTSDEMGGSNINVLGKQTVTDDNGLTLKNCLIATLTGGDAIHYAIKADTVVGNMYRVRAKVYIPSGQTIDGFRVVDGSALILGADYQNTSGVWVNVDVIDTYSQSTNINIRVFEGSNQTLDADNDIFYIKDWIIDDLTTGKRVYTSWFGGQFTFNYSTGRAISSGHYDFGSNGITMEAVFKTDGNNGGSWDTVMSHRDNLMRWSITGSTIYFRAWINIGGVRQSVSYVYDYSGTDAFFNEWIHVIMTYDKSTFRFYWNGQKRTELSMTGDIQSIGPISVGGNVTGSLYGFAGNIALARAYNKGLSEEEVAINCNSVEHRFGIGK
jgi:hypothetical protein